MNCVVAGCNNHKVFTFPKDEKVRAEWLNAIRQPSLKPKKWNGLCPQHFKHEDILREKITYIDGIPHGYDYDKVQLRKGAIPSIFPWNLEKLESTESVSSVVDSSRSKIRRIDIALGEDSIIHQSTADILNPNLNVYEEIVMVTSKKEETDNLPLQKKNSSDQQVHAEEDDDSKCTVKRNVIEGTSQKSVKKPRYDIEELKDNPKIILEFTGLENHYKFMTVFYSLGRKKQTLKIKGNGSYCGLSKENQLFLTLWKLRKNCTDTELAFHFNISRIAVSNIFRTWIEFMANQWSKIDIWPSRKLVDFYMPEGFRADFKATRVIIDATEVHIERSKNPTVQQSSFSVYKNDTTLKGVVGITPGGLISRASKLYGGSTSDRQITERMDLQYKCQSGDIIMADRGFNVQDIFAPYNVTVAIPHFKKGKGYLPFKDLMSDRKLSKYRVHVERVIGLLKTYNILSTKLGSDYVDMASEIFGVCVMLCNFKENIMCSRKK